MRPPESIKPLTNGIGRLTIPQLNKHEVNRTFYTLHLLALFNFPLSHTYCTLQHTLCAYLIYSRVHYLFLLK
jgi:hypothetical protein